MKEQSKKIKLEKKIKVCEQLVIPCKDVADSYDVLPQIKVEWVGEPGRVEGRGSFLKCSSTRSVLRMCVGSDILGNK